MFWWKGTGSDEMNLIVSKTPTIAKGKKSIEKITIPGRSGFLTIDNGTYEGFVISIECHFDKGTADQDAILAWLDGGGKLSLDNIRQWDAVITNSISLEKVLGLYRSILIQFECQPVSREIAEKTYTVSSNPATLSITGATSEMEPIMEITAVGDVQVTVNNKAFHLYGLAGKVTLDSKLKVITDHTGANISHKMLGEFPALKPGDNVIDTIGTITGFKMYYHKAFL